jgi:hypothetical protein
MGKKIFEVLLDGNLTGEYIFFCPGCKFGHSLTTLKPNHNGAIWKFNGSFDKPTFTPSLLVNRNDAFRRCHSYIIEGHIQFLDDCWHEFKGKTIELPDINTKY